MHVFNKLILLLFVEERKILLLSRFLFFSFSFSSLFQKTKKIDFFFFRGESFSSIIFVETLDSFAESEVIFVIEGARFIFPVGFDDQIRDVCFFFVSFFVCFLFYFLFYFFVLFVLFLFFFVCFFFFFLLFCYFIILS